MKRVKKNKPGESGYVVLFISVIVGLLALAMESVFLQVQSTAETDGLVLQKQRIAYLAEGISQIANKFTQDYLLTHPNLDSAASGALTSYVASQIHGMDTAPYVLSTLDLQVGSPGFGLIPSGPYVGMESYQVPLTITVKLTNPTNQVTGNLTKTSILAKLTLFQFALFGDLGTAPIYLAPGPAMDVVGRVHTNGDFCVGNYANSTSYPLRIQRVTSSGAVRNIRDSSCLQSPPTVADDTSFSTDPSDLVFQELKPGAGSGCTNCDGTGLDWRVYAQTIWKGNILDMAHQVQPLKLPFSGTESVQSGVRADNTNADNTGSLRVLVDPVIAADTANTLDHKFSANADIRIINGVWYLKDPLAPTSWPGVPIWSDHPGRFITENEEGIEGTMPVGQDDIRDRWFGSATQWPVANTPHGFSYYEYDPVSTSLRPDTTGTVSYGTLFRTAGATPVWGPGQWASPPTSIPSPTPSPFPTFLPMCDVGFSCVGCKPNIPLNALDPASFQCTSGAQPGIPDFLLNGTRSGFKDGQLAAQYVSSPPPLPKLAKILPVNFDVAAFQASLTNFLPGELGSYFGTGRYMKRNFNGIVYITQTWKGSMKGLGGLAPDSYPYQGDTADPTQATITYWAQQQALPFPLCSSAAADLAGGLAGNSYTGTKANFRVPDCKLYSPSYAGIGAILARPNAVRIINASIINPAATTPLPNGLTIATNMPAYVIGDVNTNSDTTSSVITPTKPWVPVLIAADQTMLLSNNWDDANTRWDALLSGLTRNAVDTTYNLSLLTGDTGTTRTAWSGGMENLPRFLEKWYNGGTYKKATIRGSLVLGFSSVYFRDIVPLSNISWESVTYNPPNRDFRFDPHLAKFTNQPPGAPKFNVYSVQKWTVQ